MNAPLSADLVHRIAAATCEQLSDGTRGMLAFEPWDDLDFLQQAVWTNVVRSVLDEARVQGVIKEGSFW